MAAEILDGKKLSDEVASESRKRVLHLERQGVIPALAVVLVGDDPASQVYVRNKVRASEALGIRSVLHRLQADTTERELLALIADLNGDEKVHGILVQLPLPKGLSDRKVIEAIAAEKDVDGFHVNNVGRLMIGEVAFLPCTPHGVMRLLEKAEVDLRGKRAVVVGASNIVGKPMALMLLHKGATVTVCNSKTRSLADHTREADILVVAVGRPGLITGDMVKPGAVVIDVGINRLADGRLAGDVDFTSVSRNAGYITPVPGGVGPMTVTMLMVNTIRAAEMRIEALAG